MSSMQKRKNVKLLSLFVFISLLIIEFIAIPALAWDRGKTEDSPFIVEQGTAPIIDGIIDDAWSEANNTFRNSDSNLPSMQLKAMYADNYLYILIEIRKKSSADDEFLELLLSNSTSSSDSDFMDAKLIQTKDFTHESVRSVELKDLHLNTSNSEYVNDSSLDFEGNASITPDSLEYRVYEFKLPMGTNNEDTVNDTSIILGKQFAVKVKYGIASGSSYISEVIYFQMGYLFGNEYGSGYGNEKEFQIDMNLLSNIMFTISFIAFVVIAILSLQTRTQIEFKK